MISEPVRRRLVAITVVAVGCIAGCRGEGYQTATVTGRVTYKGQPAANVRVEFAPHDGPKLRRPPANGVTAADGSYTVVRPGNKPGAVVGPSTVACFLIEGKPTSVPADAVEGRTFEVDVKAGESVHDFELGSGAGK